MFPPIENSERPGRLAISGDLIRGPVAFRVVGGNAEARHDDQREQSPVRGRETGQRHPRGRQQHRPRQEPPPRRPVRQVAEHRLDDRRRHAGDEQDRPGRGVRQTEDSLEEREQGRQRPLIHVDDEVTQRQETEHAGVGEHPRRGGAARPGARRPRRAPGARREAVESREPSYHRASDARADRQPDPHAGARAAAVVALDGPRYAGSDARDRRGRGSSPAVSPTPVRADARRPRSRRRPPGVVELERRRGAPGRAPRSAASLPRGGRRGDHPRDRRLADPPDRSARRRGRLRPPPPGGLAHPEPRELARRSREGARHRGPPRAARGRDRLRAPPVEPGPVVALGERRPDGGDRAPGRRGPDLARPALLPADAARGPGAARPDPRPRRPHGGARRPRSSSRTSRARGASRTRPSSASGAPGGSS